MSQKDEFQDLSRELMIIAKQSSEDHGKTLETARGLSETAYRAVETLGVTTRALSILSESVVRAVEMLDPESPAARELISGLIGADTEIRGFIGGGGGVEG